MWAAGGRSGKAPHSCLCWSPCSELPDPIPPALPGPPAPGRQPLSPQLLPALCPLWADLAPRLGKRGSRRQTPICESEPGSSAPASPQTPTCFCRERSLGGGATAGSAGAPCAQVLKPCPRPAPARRTLCSRRGLQSLWRKVRAGLPEVTQCGALVDPVLPSRWGSRGPGETPPCGAGGGAGGSSPPLSVLPLHGPRILPACAPSRGDLATWRPLLQELLWNQGCRSQLATPKSGLKTFYFSVYSLFSSVAANGSKF